jgi:hypothetical protein
MLCQHCFAWRCHPDERFCGNCGDNLLQAYVNIEPVSTIYQGREVPSQITTLIRNVHGGLGGTHFFWRNPETGFEVPLVNLELEALNQPNEQETYATNSAELGLDPDVPMEWFLMHQVSPDKAYCRAVLSCAIPQPHLALAQSEWVLLEQERVLPLTLRHDTGGRATVEQIKVSAYEGVALNLPEIDPALFPFTLSEGETQRLPLPLTEEVLRVLQGRPQGLQLVLAVQIKYLSQPIDLPLKLRVPIAARPRLNLPEQVRALQGRLLRLPVPIENQGGESCRLKNVQVTIRLGPKVLCRGISETSVEGEVLEAGKTHTALVVLELLDLEQDHPLAARRYQCDVHPILFEEELACPKQTIELEIRAPKPYTGMVAIDFGTTATAVAYHPKAQMGQTPLSLSLSEKDHFIPTAIAYYLNEKDELAYCIGHEAMAVLNNAQISDRVYLDNLKWQLDNPEPVLLPDGSDKLWEDIAVDYLKRIKEIIEQDSDIVAVVEQVAMTQPSRFHPLLTRALNRAYHKAKFKPLPLSLGDKIQSAIAESWPSLITCLPLHDLKSFQFDTVGDPVLGNSHLIGQHAVLTYDVGGGSTDLSLFLIAIENMATMQITDLQTDGTGKSDHFFGNGFSGLLFKHLWPACEMWLLRQGYDPSQFPISLPWERLRPGADQIIARQNGRRCAAFILKHLQSDTGPFEQINLRLRHIGIWDDSQNEELANIMNEVQELFDRLMNQTSLTLQGLHGAAVTIPSGSHHQGNGLSLNFEGFIKEFIESCSFPMFKRLQRLLHHSEVSELKVYLLVSGRGAFFPLVGTMLWAHQERLRNENKKEGKKEIQKIEQVRVDPKFAKTIVSQGACYLAKLSNVASGITFIPRHLPSLCIQGDLDPNTGIPQLIPLCHGLPSLADGWQIAPYPIRPGYRVMHFSFYLSTHNKPMLSPEDKLLIELSQELELAPEIAEKACIMIKAKAEDCLEIYLGKPSDMHQTDYEHWDKHLLGHYEMTPGACLS